jgi:hypothetical protein
MVCEAVRWVADEPQPGWIEVVLTDADGRTWRFFDKPPIFGSSESLTSASTFPVPVTIGVQIIQDGDPAVVSTAPDGVESEEGEHIFRVSPSALLR